MSLGPHIRIASLVLIMVFDILDELPQLMSCMPLGIQFIELAGTRVPLLHFCTMHLIFSQQTRFLSSTVIVLGTVTFDPVDTLLEGVM